jgi:hypothetical protein
MTKNLSVDLKAFDILVLQFSGSLLTVSYQPFPCYQGFIEIAKLLPITTGGPKACNDYFP